MSRNYDNWERLVNAVVRVERDKQIAMIHSEESSSFISSSSSFTSTSLFGDDHQSLTVHQESSDLPLDYSDLPPIDHRQWRTINSLSNKKPIGEEARWLREEQRWLREEQRWLREESRWNAHRQALLQEIRNLNLRIQELQRLNSLQGVPVSETVANIAKSVQEGDLGKTASRIANSAIPFVFEAAKKDEEEEEEVVVKEVISITDQKEFCNHLEMLFGSSGSGVLKTQQHKSTDPEKSANGAPVASIVTEAEVSRHKVFLLGENRWEEPSSGNTLLVMECDGTGSQVRELSEFAI